MLLVAAGVVLGLVLATELGFQLGRRFKSETADERSPLGAVQGGVLGILGLLLGFGFAGAASRFVDRQDITVREANAIGTAVLRTDLLDEPHRTRCREALLRYLDRRVTLFEEYDDDRFKQGLAECDELHKQMWAAAVAGGRSAMPVVAGVLPPINDVIDLHTTRIAAGRRHMPLAVTALLLISAIVSLGFLGYRAGVGGRRNVGLIGPLVLLVAFALWATIDMDFPRHGLIRVNQDVLLDLQRTLR